MTTQRSRRRRYASGRHAIAECERSGQKMRYKDLVEDGHVPGLLVHPDWYEPRHPQELPIDTSDAVALWRPAPEKSVPDGEFDTLAEWEAWVPTQCPASPLDLQYFESTTLATPAVVNDLSFTLDDAVLSVIGQCLFVELDAGGWFVTQVAMDNPKCPSFTIAGITHMTGAAAIGNDVFVGPTGSGDPILDGIWVVT